MCIQAYMYVHVCMCVCMCVCMYVCLCMYVCVCVYIFVNCLLSCQFVQTSSNVSASNLLVMAEETYSSLLQLEFSMFSYSVCIAVILTFYVQ